jgi:hypothetical protein
MYMSLRSRLASLERASGPPPERKGPVSMAEWLARWEALGEAGFFDGEADFEEAMALFRAQVIAAAPDAPEWDSCCPAWDWIAEIYMRIRRGLPPVTVSEYLELADWYRRHESAVYDINLRVFLADATPRGARRDGVTQVVRRLRRLRAEHPELV